MGAVWGGDVGGEGQPISLSPTSHALSSLPGVRELTIALLTLPCLAYIVTGSQDSVINAYQVPKPPSSSPDAFAAATSSEPSRTMIGHTSNVCCVDGLVGGGGIGEYASLLR